MNVGIKSKHHDYTAEIIRCFDFIVQQMKRGVKVSDAITQAEQSYGYAIALNAQRAVYKFVK
jgi:hypothetical protein